MIVIRGMYGVGDCIHQRAFVRDLLAKYPSEAIILETFYWSMYHDLAAQYQERFQLKLIGGVMPRIKDEKQAYLPRTNRVNDTFSRRDYRVTYSRETIHRYGSILAAQYACVGLKMPERPDFSLPVPDAWRTRARLYRAAANSQGKPLMVYRPSVLNNVWLSKARSPQSQDYATLYKAIRDDFFVVSIANIGNKGEYIDGPEMDADLKFHHGELNFEELAGLFAEADVAFTCPGFAPVLSQAVGTPTVIVYGGNESYATTNVVGQYLARTLAIEPVDPCACHLKEHDCNKTMDVPKQLDRLCEFVAGILEKSEPRMASCAS